MAQDVVAPPPCSSRRVDPNAAPTQLPVLPIVPLALPHLPASRAEMEARGWDDVDVVFVTGDAYVDHPAFAMGILGRVLEAAGFRVAILSQPDWRSAEPWRQFGRPRLFFGISAGNMDSMINHYTANKKVRNDDAYSPGGRIGLRPDRATMPYCQRAREAFPGVPVIAGGVEASLRRLAHYDYWSDTVRRSIVLDAKADLVVFGMGEHQIVEIARRLAAGETVKDLRDMRGVAFALGASETPPAEAIVLPSFEEVKADKRKFAQATKVIHQETNPLNAKTAGPVPRPPGGRLQSAGPADQPGGHGPDLRPALHAQAAPDVPGQKIPAYEVVKDSVTIMRGCFGGCTFCSITAHQGRIIQSRSQESVLAELRPMGADPTFSGVVSDLGGPTANMYQMRCTRPEVEAKCKRLSCVHPTICKLLGTDHGPLVELMRQSREVPGVDKVFVASGIRMDLAQKSPEYMEELAKHHVGGHLKVAPEHTDANVLRADEKARLRRLPGVCRGVPEGQPEGGEEAVPRPLFHRLASRQRPERDDRPGRLPEAERLQARPGAGLHPRPVRHRHLHVLHRARPVHRSGSLRRARTCETASCSGRCCSSSSRRTTSRSARPCWPRAGTT